MTRTISKGLAGIVEALELEQKELVTSEYLDELVARHDIRSPTRQVASRLRQRGWLLPTGQRGVWEFSPGAAAGPYGRGDRTVLLSAALSKRDLACGLTFQAAAWAHGLADRAPARLEVAAASASVQAQLPKGLNVSVFAPHLSYQHAKRVPVLAVESVLVHMAAKPNHVRSWESALEWLPVLAAEAEHEAIAEELSNRAATVGSRLGYLLQAMRPDISSLIPPGTTKTWFGPRGPLLRHDNRWMIADTLLPFDPRNLQPAR